MNGVAFTNIQLLIMEFVSKGLKDYEIAAARGVKTRTVESEVSALLQKTGCNNRAELAALYMKMAQV